MPLAPFFYRRSLTIEKDWVIVLRAAGLGSQALTNALTQFSSVAELRQASARDLRLAGLEDEAIHALAKPDLAAVEADLEWLDQPGHHLVTLDHPDYPALLKKIPGPPVALWLAGDTAALWQPQLAVIGSRNPTRGGLDLARDFAGELARQGLAITSGLARGIDTQAHRAALEAGGQTVAVMGTGLRQVYPAVNQDLAKQIQAHGALVSELPLEAPPRRQHFPSRNRIISGLSLGVLVVEAGLNSGTLITARMAADQGREVFALPGSLHNPMVKGCHRLIKQGARLVESTGDIMAELAPLAGELADDLRQRLGQPGDPSGELTPVPDASDLRSDPVYVRLLDAIAWDPVPVDTVVESTGLPAREISGMLLMLELQGLVEMHTGGRVSRLV